MNISSLTKYGVDNDVINVWEASGHSQLLPVQEKAIVEGKVLEGRNAVVFSPTSSGKTFIGEMAAIRMARRNQRVLYLVPQKALAEEKFREFHEKYSALGIRVVISTRDRQEFDRDIRRGRFNIAVAVFEKMQGLLVASPKLLPHIGLVVVDELQMIGDRNRGGKLELLLTKIKLAATKAQIIGLSAVLGKSHTLASWLNASLVEVEKRPVELRKGVIDGNEFRFAEHNSKREATENVAQPVERMTSAQTLLFQVAHFVERGEQCLVFCKTKRECSDYARMLTARLQHCRSARALVDIARLEDSGTNPMLARLLEYGVAFHNTDLSWQQRDLVEKHFRANEIRVIFTTTTLAMGLNLPARNVFIDPEHWEFDRNGHGMFVPISQAEYENISGRAGRYRLENDFGRAIIVADTPFFARAFFDVYVRGKLDDIAPALANGSLSNHVLGLVASGFCQTRAQVHGMLLASYTGEMIWRGGSREAEFNETLEEGLSNCVEDGLLIQDGKSLSVTELGRTAAMKGISVNTAIQLAAFASENLAAASDIQPVEILFALASTEEGTEAYLNMATAEFESGRFENLFQSIVAGLPPRASSRLLRAWKTRYSSYEHVKLLKKVLILHAWITGVPAAEIEKKLACSPGMTQGLAEVFAWLAEALCGIAKAFRWPESVRKNLGILSRQISHGVSEEGVEIISLRVRGLGRERTRLLLDRGIDSIQKISRTKLAVLEELLTKPVAETLLQRVKVAETEEATGEKGWDEFTPDEAPIEDLGDPHDRNEAAGAPFRAPTAKLRLLGQPVEKRFLVTINGHPVQFRPQPFVALLKLALAMKEDGVGWVAHTNVVPDADYHQVVRRIKEDIRDGKVKAARLIENGTKRYRLSVPPTQIQIDGDSILKNVPLDEPLLSELKQYTEARVP